MTIRTIPLLFFLALLSSCIEEFHPQIDENEYLLVVDGGITNEDGPYVVNLSVTSGLEKIIPEPVSDAKVFIIEEDGMEELLSEVKPGSYQSKENGIKGSIGKRYKLRVENDGNIYSSEFEALKEPTPISSVDAKVEYRPSPNQQLEVPGYQFYVNSEESPYENDYFLWKLEGSYKYESQLLIYYVFEGSFRKFEEHDSLKVCYRNYNIGQIFTSNTNNLLEAKVVNKPIFFLPAIDSKLSIRYSLLTKQYSVSKEAYNFWHGVEQQNANSESLYTSQPYQIRGNLRNINDPDEPVLGYFLVAGISRNRIFVDRPPEDAIYVSPCGFDTESLPYIVFTGPSEWPIYITKNEEGNNALSGFGCLDCRDLKGKLEKPDFWVD